MTKNEELEKFIKNAIKDVRLRGGEKSEHFVYLLGRIWNLHDEIVKDLESKKVFPCIRCEEKDKEISALKRIASVKEERFLVESEFDRYQLSSLTRENNELKLILEKLTRADAEIYEAIYQITESHKEQYGHDGSSFERLAEVTESN